MPVKVAIATAAYPTKAAFIAQFVEGVADAARAHGDLRLIMAVEQGFDLTTLLPPLPQTVELDPWPAAGHTTPAGLRRVMIEAARKSDAETVIFCDFDDRLVPDALDLHAAALAAADISYGEMRVMDEDGRPLDRMFPRAASMPEQFDGVGPLLSRNFMGFSNTAVRRCALLDAATAIPDDLVAADWWFFTMLLAAGCRAKRTSSPVADYRVYARNTLGANASYSVDALRRRGRIAERHYAAVSGVADATKHAHAVTHLLETLDRDPSATARLVAAAAAGDGAWFEDVTRACGLLETQPGPVH